MFADKQESHEIVSSSGDARRSRRSFSLRAALRPRHVDRGQRPSRRNAGRIVGVRLQVGQDLLGDPLRLRSRAHRPVRLRGRGRPQAGRRPRQRRSGGPRCASPTPGLLVIGYRSKPSAVETDAGEVQPVSEGRGPRRRRRAASRAARDRRNGPRAVLALRQEPGACPARPAPRRAIGQLGFTLELVAERNPYAIPADGICRFA